MLADYAGVLVILVIGTALVCIMLGIQMLLGPKREFAEKQEPFECGEKQIVSPHQRYAVKFYMVAILFVVFDVEAIFFYPWAATSSRSAGSPTAPSWSSLCRSPSGSSTSG